MEKDNTKPILKFEPGSRQPFILYLISITIISAIIVIVCLFTSGISFSKESDKLLGDINFDGTINTADVMILSSYMTGQVKFDKNQMVAADVDNSGEINSKDYILIMQHINTQSSITTDPAEAEQTTESNTSADITDSTGSDDVTENTSDIEDTSTFEENTNRPEQSIQPDVDFVNSGKSKDAAFLTSEGGIYYIARISNSWQASNGRYMYQIDFTAKNNSQKTMYNTSAKVNLNADVMIEKNWNCTTKNETGVVTVTTENEGRTKSGGTFSCGFIVSSGSPITIESVTK